MLRGKRVRAYLFAPGFLLERNGGHTGRPKASNGLGGDVHYRNGSSHRATNASDPSAPLRGNRLCRWGNDVRSNRAWIRVDRRPPGQSGCNSEWERIAASGRHELRAPDDIAVPTDRRVEHDHRECDAWRGCDAWRRERRGFHRRLRDGRDGSGWLGSG